MKEEIKARIEELMSDKSGEQAYKSVKEVKENNIKDCKNNKVDKYIKNECEPLLKWLAKNDKNLSGASLHIIGSRSSKGSQFAEGLSGVAGLLIYPVDFVAIDEAGDCTDGNHGSKFDDDADFI